MKRLQALCLAILFALPTLACAAEAPWDEQLRELDHNIFHISGINAINALNLSPDQITRLKALAG